jgi:hypothetical protein
MEENHVAPIKIKTEDVPRVASSDIAAPWA